MFGGWVYLNRKSPPPLSPQHPNVIRINGWSYVKEGLGGLLSWVPLYLVLALNEKTIFDSRMQNFLCGV